MKSNRLIFVCKKLSWVAFIAGFSLSLSAQLTLRVTSIPANTPAGSNIHVAGNFQNWDPTSTAHILTPLGSGRYEITFTPAVGTVEYKFTRGSWTTVEGNATGGYQPNRTVEYTGTPKTVELQILSWEGMGGGGTGTAAANVSILSNSFYMPQLNKNRRIWLYLPPDYQTSVKKYPVLYMHDGQNLFDQNTSAFGEWKVDESLNKLFDQGDYGCIVIGIDNGGADRIDEYTPWVNPQYGGGEGDEYMRFIVETLKPHIDANYRTLPGRLTTGIGGSSMGGLISMYGLMEYQNVFSKAAIFSPAFWINGSQPANHVLASGKKDDARVYFLAGIPEDNGSVVADMQEVADAMLQAGFSSNELYWQTPADGQHSEWFWAREFPAAYVWLFQGNFSPATEAAEAVSDLEVYPNPAGEWLRLSGEHRSEKVDYQIVGADGKVWQDSVLAPGEAAPIGKLPAGVYFFKIEKNGRAAGVRKFSKGQ